MPAPSPKPNETQADFLQRCIPFFINEKMFPKQAAAVCIGIFTKGKRKADLAPSLDYTDHSEE